ncbi:amino acid ABC transporter permease [Paenibacillus sp. FSL R7-0048]|jgi:polar amino acid transport system permease protein|uniref:Polar amino acid ABC transporter permease n=1 Tax=Paenibacillus odorifer TaxID=189426 RepID=A0ABX3GSB9_9BACL|nr:MULTISPECIES: amino acid ABC transporter permease [Paenibacillus]MDH6429823.1 polar amino acid transport system permease protein [Paenibacillus sp. PastH-4]MDH6446077.1 polar amino acid transport system permease protein [Paenibacillus sp. PastF-4]MDH6530454.1 polar amino acid transport system permease protein [Paenibacillus sp. PastH-3]OMC73117.1 polar amino acid ABC transporter permease [Paenibacillus odorifer]OMC76723.1 polar amino acid ABC transporter permease [Paenibacillus odorifer]
MNLDWEFIYESLPLYGEAMWLTVKLALLAIVFSLLIGLLFSIVLYYKVKIVSDVIKIYIELSRNTPLLVQLFFLYYGLPKIGIHFSEMTCAIVGMTFLGGSYMTEAFRSGFEAVSQSQIESGQSIGLSKLQLVRYVIFPQAFAISIPSLGANAIFLLKETSIVGAIALMDLMNVAKDLIGMHYKTAESLLLLVLAYLVLVLPLSLLLTWVERKVRYAEFGD